jgi:hypothetical protein
LFFIGPIGIDALEFEIGKSFLSKSVTAASQFYHYIKQKL